MSNPVYAAFVMGQGGWLTSYGMIRMASRARAIGIEADTFRYFDTTPLATHVREWRARGYRIALVGYSLGNTLITWYQSSNRGCANRPADLLLAIAESKLGQNHPIEKHNTKRSVLWYTPGSVLSGAGLTDGFDVMHSVETAHLWMDFAQPVIDGVMAELTALQG